MQQSASCAWVRLLYSWQYLDAGRLQAKTRIRGSRSFNWIVRLCVMREAAWVLGKRRIGTIKCGGCFRSDKHGSYGLHDCLYKFGGQYWAAGVTVRAAISRQHWQR
jgi:hypothetical protein